MKIWAYFTFLSAPLAAGCGSIPPLASEYTVSVTDIVENIRCELRDASLTVPFLTKPNGWLAGMDLSLQAVAFSEAGIDLNATVPLNPGSAKVNAGTAMSGTADRKVTFSFSADFTDPKTMTCGRDVSVAVARGRLQGSLGIEAWLVNLQRTMDETSFKPEKAGYILEFTLVRGAGGGVAISAIPSGESLLGGTFTFGGNRTDVHTLTMAYLEKSPPPPPKKKGARPKAPPSAADRSELQNDLNNLILRQSDNLR